MSESSALSLAEVVAVLEQRFDPSIAEDWDRVGLVAGDPHQPVTKVLFAVDPLPAVVDEAAAATQDRSPCQPIVLHLGGHERNRGTRLMIEAFHQVLQDMPRARLLLVGHFEPPALEREVRDDIALRGIGHAVTITGRVPFETIGDYLLQAAVGWVPWQGATKNKKNIPTKLFEYMAYGVPIVSSDLPSTRPFVREGETGHLVAVSESAAHAEAILRLLREPPVALAMGRRGQELVRERYHWDRMERQLLALYEELLS